MSPSTPTQTYEDEYGRTWMRPNSWTPWRQLAGPVLDFPLVVDGAVQQTQPSRDDPISRPVHYTKGKIEVKSFIADQDFNFFAGNVVKYVCRYRHKGTPLQDLLKAREYLNMLIELEEERQKPPRLHLVPQVSDLPSWIGVDWNEEQRRVSNQ